MKIIIQKFGGTSVANSENRSKAVAKVIAAKQVGYFPVVVVSAMGRKGEPYATDTLIQFATGMEMGIKPRDLDMLMSCGETISAVVMATALNTRGTDSVALTGGQAGIITDNNHGDASVIKVDTNRVYRYIERERVPVITGFQGVTEYGDITTLGRGGSDVTAAVLGQALNAHQVEIYTDVDGVMTADPRIINSAKVIKSVDYNEIFQMADSGARVIHPRAVEIAMKSGLPLVIKNTFSDSPGTLITQFKKDDETIPMGDRGLLTGIAHLHNRAQVVIDYSGEDLHGSGDDILDQLAGMGISIDLINIFTDKKVFTVDEKDCERVAGLLQERKEKFSINRNCSKVTVIGNRIRGVPGVMARILRVLNQNSIRVYQTADSHATISVLVKTEDAKKAVVVLHDEFKL
ncbi:MAG: aspartate kinase [Bacillota bacterium]|nr:aspartate kinase [Bacillota bacterium]MDD3297281.1 aspartate kinase [Bacillota bacterium]MDD3850455.1 aspartate kinase [Bacillota bacterium]MDD4706797.1 aspartate kinase [Bacillota bacterium]